MTTMYIGKPTSRVDGRAKVTGTARYAAEHRVSGLAFGWIVSSTVARGRIVRIQTDAASALPGVLRVFTHENAPRLARFDRSYRDEIAPPGAPFRPLQDGEIRFSHQPVALVVAESLELARYAASLIRVEYESSPVATDLEAQRPSARAPKPRPGLCGVPDPRGDPDAAWESAAVRVDAVYRAPAQHHNPMEPFATTVFRQGDGRLTVYDKTQGVQNVQSYLCRVFGCSKSTLRVVSPFVGGAFGSGLRPQATAYLAVLAARELERSVRVSMTRQQMFSFAHRPATWQRVALGATEDGCLISILHEAVAETSRFEDYSEAVVFWSGLLYACDNVQLDHKVVQLDVATPGDMRAPGAAWGLFALESAMDELATKLDMDPLELRLRNYSERDSIEDLPFSSKALRECYRQGADRFGWSRRNLQPRATRAGDVFIGQGMATGIWEASQHPATARAELSDDGELLVSSATADIGTGTYTIMTQIAAERMGLPLEKVTFLLGDSSFPRSPVEGGSWTAATIGSAVLAACDKLRKKLLLLARKLPASPLKHATPDEVVFADGWIRSAKDPARGASLIEILRQSQFHRLEAEAGAKPSSKQKQYSRYAHSAVFAEVQVDAELGTTVVTRVVSAVAAGRILNPKTARSQVLGGVVWGIGSALEEESVLDHGLGRFMNHSFAEYHVPVHADVREIEVIFVDEVDNIVNPLGAKGLGEIGIVGVAAAVANAIYNATGRRVRDLPITPDKLL